MPVKRNGWPPRWLTKTTPAERRRGDGAAVGEFISDFCRITKDTIAGPTGSPIILRSWQTELLAALCARRRDGRRKHRQGLIGMPRKNGKTALGAGIGLHGLYMGLDGGEIYSVAGDREQARICFGMAKRMVELDPELSATTHPYRDALEHAESGSVYRVLSSDAPLKEGLNPSLVIFDEVHVQPNDDLWSVMNLGSGARPEALVLGITTAGAMKNSDGTPTLCFGLYEYGRAVAKGEAEDPAFFFAWWEPRAGLDADYRAPKTWVESNPGYDDIVGAEDFAENLPPKVPEHQFRTKRTNVWVESTIDGWLADAPGAYTACAAPELDLPMHDCVMAWDMSLRHDSTAVGVFGRVGDRVVARVKIFTADPSTSKIDFVAVRSHIRLSALIYGVTAIGYDPRYLEFEAQHLEDEGLPMWEFPQSPERMAPATVLLRELIVSNVFAHDGDPELSEHVLSAVKRETDRGFTLSKGKSKRPIDGCIVCAMGVALLENETEDEPVAFVVGGIE